jgi:cobalt/nickel transport protein
MKRCFLLLFAGALLLPTWAQAHFQVIYLPKLALTSEDSAQQRLQLFFTHPFEGGPVMDMGKDLEGNLRPPFEFGMLHKGERIDLTSQLQDISFRGVASQGAGFAAEVTFRGLGDYVFFLEPAPYYDKPEDAYIQHVTKVIANRGGLSTDWDTDVKLPVEIRPLTKPYALWAGNVFQGQVLRKNGDEMEPVPFAEVEVEFFNFAVEENRVNAQPIVGTPQAAFVTQVIFADENGVFTYGMPRAGWWGFAAIGAGGEGMYRGKALELGAVLWVEATEMK